MKGEGFAFLLVLLFRCRLISGQKNLYDTIVDFAAATITAPFGTFPEFIKIDDEYDFIIIGAGAGGTLMANRLSEVENWRILLIEAGGEEGVVTDVPLASPYLSQTPYNWGYTTSRQEGVCEGMEGKVCHWPRGKVLGGTTVINYMLYTRGNKKDFDRWEQMGNTGWGSKDVWHYFKKFENVELREGVDASVRGTNGELSVINPPFQTPVAEHHLQAGIERGLKVRDINGEQQIGISYTQGMLTRKGRRDSGAKAFLKPIKKRSNLVVAKNARVTKINIDPETKTAVSVDFEKDLRRRTVRARKEIILSAGTLNSPQILMLSGVGPEKHLTELGIPVIQDLPVGQTLQDHVLFPGLTYFYNESVTVVDVRLIANPGNLVDYFARGEGPLTSPGGAEVYAFLNTRKSDSDFPGLDPEIPDIEVIYPASSFAGDFGQGLRKAFGISDEVYYNTWFPTLGRDGITTLQILLKPESVGFMRLRSTNPYDDPLFFPNYYKNENDLKHMLRGIRATQDLIMTRALAQFNPQIYTKKLPGCEQHVFDSDDYWICSAKLLSNNLHHQIGTCRMGPDEDKTAVVSPDLLVKGIKKLRVVDASVMPEPPSGHTTAPTFMIAEKAADMVKAAWKNT